MNLSPQFQIAAARRILYRAGLDSVDIAGQVTLRVDGEPGRYWTSPMETFDVSTPEEVVQVQVSDDGRFAVEGGGRLPVSTASGWIDAIYEARPDVSCVIHTHSLFIGVVAQTGDVVQMYNNRTLIFHEDQAYFDDDGTETDSKDRIVGALGRKNVLIQRNHGAVVVGDSIEVATARAILLERAAQFQVFGQGIGGKPFSDNPTFMERRKPHVANLGLVWDSHLRRLHLTDPDLFTEAR